jgi:hypothetical protein
MNIDIAIKVKIKVTEATFIEATESSLHHFGALHFS